MRKSVTSDKDESKNVESGSVLSDSGELEEKKKSSSSKSSSSKKRKKSTRSPRTKSVRLLKNAKYKIRGKSSGKEYVFDGAGTVVKVNSKDVKELMEKNNNRSNSCCGGVSGKIFELA